MMEHAFTISAPKTLAGVVDRDVEQRSWNDARFHQRRAARQIL